MININWGYSRFGQFFYTFWKRRVENWKKNAIANFIVLSSIDDNLYTFISLNYLIKWEKKMIKNEEKNKIEKMLFY